MSPSQTSASDAFPLEPKKMKMNIDYEAEDKKSGFDPNAINLKLVELPWTIFTSSTSFRLIQMQSI